jgi:3-deoxy-D-arabino-heptulosonate 7-phosphate (DAHP) synthase class II
MSNPKWSVDSWKSKPVLQDVVYEDQVHFDKVLKKLNHLPPMVTPTEVILGVLLTIHSAFTDIHVVYLCQ